jgi:succinate-semialdehyde dehydrogenase/glutarate-semialdehyde dehydrogenase
VPVGKQLARLAAEHMKPCTMELGGHAPVIVFDDVDVDTVVPKLVAGKFRNAGQVCISPTRFYVHENVYHRTLDAFAERTAALKVGDGLDPKTQMGPLANVRRRDALSDLVDSAVSDGARVVVGGARMSNRGYFYAPTVLSDVPGTARVMRDEPFGPVALFAPFSSREEVLRLANDTDFGLASYVFTRSAANADLVANELRSGMVSINHFGLGNPETPFGGVKDSGYGREGGAEALASYLVAKFVSHELQ